MVLTSAVKTALSDLSIWTETTNGYKSLSVLALSDVPLKVGIKIRIHGFLCALHLYTLGQPLLPCSPFLLLYTIGASKLLFDLQLVKLLAPDIGNMLTNVNDENNNLVHDRSPTGPLAALLATHLFLQVRHIMLSFHLN